MRIGIYGGTFSPVHIGHIRAAKAFIEQIGLDKLMIIPANIPPHKESSDILPAEERMELCRLAFEGEKIEVSDIEIQRGEKSYTYDTLTELKNRGYDDIYMLCGTDMIDSFESWYRYKDIFSLATIVRAQRYGTAYEAVDAAEAKVSYYMQNFGAKIIKLNMPLTNISSSEIRLMIKDGIDVSTYLPSAEYEYIKKKGFYLD